MDFDSNAQLNNGEYTEGGGGVPPSIITARWMNALTYSLRNLVVAAGEAPDIDNHDLVRIAVDNLISTAVAALVDSSPAALDTLNELAEALNDDPDFATTMTNALAGKSDNGHGHAIADVTGLQTALDSKSNTGHGHAIGDVTGLQTALDGKAGLNSNVTFAAVTATSYNATSDRRLKWNIQPAPIGITRKLRGVVFDWIESGKRDAGAIAQEVEKVLPHLVHTNPNTPIKSINYTGLIAYLIQDSNADAERIDRLEKQNAALQERLERLEAKLV